MLLEILFVWMGVGALTLLFCCAGFGPVVSYDGKQIIDTKAVAILLMFLILWPRCWAMAYADREDFNF